MEGLDVGKCRRNGEKEGVRVGSEVLDEGVLRVNLTV